MKQACAKSKKKSWFQELMDGYAWACNNTRLMVTFLLFYVLLIVIIGWHTNQALCWLTGVRHLYGVPFLIIGLLGMLTLIHEADHVWKYQWSKIPIGILSIFFIYYCMIDFLWWIIETTFCLTSEVSACGTLISAIASAAVVAMGYRNTKHIRTVSYRILLGQGEKEFRIALISDLHLGAFVGVDHIKRIVEAVNAIHPDLIIIAGDLIDDDNSILSEPAELQQLSCEFRQFQSKYGAMLTLGNHDPNADDPAFRAFLEESHIQLLHNQILELPAVNVVGVSDPAHNKRVPIGNLMADGNPAKPTIVVDHDPRYMDTAVAQNAHLILSGHTHAGQFFPASVLTRIALGKQRFYGHHIIGNTHAVVTSGVGFFNLPVRLCTSNEIVKIVLSSQMHKKDA